MKTLNTFIIERLKLNKDTKFQQYHFFPKDFWDLRSLLIKLLKERGKDASLNDIDVSNVDTFYDTDTRTGLFNFLDPHNINISEWNVKGVKNMIIMFGGCRNFNCDLSDWDVSGVRYMANMFVGCWNFTGKGLDNWTPIKCENLSSMFDGCKSLEKYPSWYKK